MKFMRQEGDLPIEAAQASKTENLDSKWISEFTETTEITKPVEKNSTESEVDDTNVLSAIDEQAAVIGSWVDEFAKHNPSTSTGKPNEYNIYSLMIHSYA